MNKEKIHKFRRKLGWIVFLVGWFLFLDPIITCINSFSIRLMILAIAKCIIAIPVCKMIIRIGTTIGKMMILDWF